MEIEEIDFKNKLKNLPTIYYVNLDNRIDRREYMESQFDRWKISNYKRVSSTKYLVSEINHWRYCFDGEIYNYGKCPHSTANAITHVEMIKTWLETTNDPYMIMMEDDYDLNLIEYWHFDWNYLMNHIPYDWDCIQLGFECRDEVKFFLHPKPEKNTYFGACMITRSHAEKIVKLHYKNNKYNLSMKTADYSYIKEGQSACVDYIICSTGKTYCIPLITCNVEFGSFEDNVDNYVDYHDECRKLYYHWWKYEKNNFTLEEFFTYNKDNDYKMIKKVYV
jgi:hypothetical protein